MKPVLNDNIINQYNNTIDYIREELKTKSIRTVYNAMTKKGIVILQQADTYLEIVVECRYDFTEIYVSIWYEPLNSQERGMLRSITLRL